MPTTAATINEYIESLNDERKEVIQNLIVLFNKNLPSGFEACMQYGMPSFVVPHKIYPAGYHCTTNLPLPFISIASQKSHIGIYHMCLYADPQLYNWFVEAFKQHSNQKLDIGKSCLRFKKAEHIPFKLLEELAKKVTPFDWIKIYETNFLKKQD